MTAYGIMGSFSFVERRIENYEIAMSSFPRDSFPFESYCQQKSTNEALKEYSGYNRSIDLIRVYPPMIEHRRLLPCKDDRKTPPQLSEDRASNFEGEKRQGKSRTRVDRLKRRIQVLSLVEHFVDSRVETARVLLSLIVKEPRGPRICD